MNHAEAALWQPVPRASSDRAKGAVCIAPSDHAHSPRTSGTSDIVDRALHSTGLVVSSAAAIMTAVFVAFALADMAAIRQLGTALAIAIALDATVVRLALLPALARLLGQRLWWPKYSRPIPTPQPHEI